MSIKIYDAYKFNGTIQELNDVLFKTRKKYYKHCFEQLDVWGKIPVSSVKELYIKNENMLTYNKYGILGMLKEEFNTPINTLNSIYLTYALGTVIESNLNDPLNFQSSAVVYFYKEEIFVQFFGLPRKFKLDKRFIDFHYQTSTDKDEDISDEEWIKRKKVWDKVLSTWGIPSVCGFTFLFLENSNLLVFCSEYKKWRSKNERKKYT